MMYSQVSYECDMLFHLKVTETMLSYMFTIHNYNFSHVDELPGTAEWLFFRLRGKHHLLLSMRLG